MACTYVYMHAWVSTFLYACMGRQLCMYVDTFLRPTALLTQLDSDGLKSLVPVACAGSPHWSPSQPGSQCNGPPSSAAQFTATRQWCTLQIIITVPHKAVVAIAGYRAEGQPAMVWFSFSNRSRTRVVFWITSSQVEMPCSRES